MSAAGDMRLSLRVPTRTVFEASARSVFAVAENGAFGLLPRHADHVAPLVPSVLVVTGTDGREYFFGIDHGLLVKHGARVEVVVRRAVRGEDLASLSDTIDAALLEMDEAEREARTAMSRLEVGIVRQFAELRKPAA
ncbi:MAG TPA: F0F1 ATP synthase subunit epsilon [Chiayiivirga sp.]|nr:F0F1 ATP synthase subunit epsilon [Chiayiivirga sp.]